MERGSSPLSSPSSSSSDSAPKSEQLKKFHLNHRDFLFFSKDQSQIKDKVQKLKKKVLFFSFLSFFCEYMQQYCEIEI
ncbi:hypothetical protein RIF29_15892 [Crotalaria pallida]|uniref:Uncharacterized protein n=1 Tax=Crotalaria pallida TaxID=3830 RepID=A0AAN9IBJ7_CROPI